jgi:hypothetical protein
MAKLKGHKAGCKCVGCSAATRKRGQAALQRHQQEQGAERAKPTRKGKTNPERGERAARAGRAVGKAARGAGRAVASAAGAAREAFCEPTRRNAEDAGQKRTPRGPSLADTPKGHYLVTVCRHGNAVSSTKAFPKLADAKQYVKDLKGATRATISRVASNWT